MLKKASSGSGPDLFHAAVRLKSDRTNGRERNPMRLSEKYLYGIKRKSRRTETRNPRLGQKRDASRFVTRQSVIIAR
jgi:hypothetical protein